MSTELCFACELCWYLSNA